MSFNPENHGFRKIDYSPAPDSLDYYERLADEIELSGHDMRRLNVYLSQHGNFVNIWFGLLDAFTAQCSLGFADDQRFNFLELYVERLFRGYIEADNTGEIILTALRVDEFSPQALRLDDHGKLECYSLPAA